MLEGNKKIFHEIPSENGIFTYTNVIIPCIDEDSDAITGMQGVLEEGDRKRKINKEKRVYITRAEKGVNDRIYEYKKFKNSLTESGFTIVNPINYTSEERLKLIGDSSFILTDSGSCALNGLLFGNKESTIKCMIPQRVLRSCEWQIVNQLCMGFKQGTRGQWLPLQSYEESRLNPWYDICLPPSPDEIERILDKN